MKKHVLILLLCFYINGTNAQVQTKTIDSYGVKFIVAEKIPEELNFLIGLYKDVKSNEIIKLNTDGTLILKGKSYKYWLECTDNNFIAKVPNYDRPDPQSIPASQRPYYSLINLIVASPYTLNTSKGYDGKTFLGEDSVIINFQVVRIMVNIEDNKAFINNSYEREVKGDLQKFNSITKNGPIAPLRTDTKEMCDCIAIHEKPVGEEQNYFDYRYEKRLMDLSGADVTKESREACTEKISKWWNKYKTLFSCKSSTFDVAYGNILKFAVVHGFAPFLETIVGTYQMDINFVDPVDNRNVLDYVNDDLKRTISLQGPTHPQVKLLKEYKELLIDLGCTPSKPVNN